MAKPRGRPRGRRPREPKKPIPILSLKMYCPASGFRYSDPETGKLRQIQSHFMVARMCKTNEAVFLVCETHRMRAFLKSAVLVAEVKRMEGLDAPSPAHTPA